MRAGASCTTRCRLFKFLVRIFVNEWLFQIFVPKSREVPGLLCFVHGAVAGRRRYSSLVKSLGVSILTPPPGPKIFCVLSTFIYFAWFALSTGLVTVFRSLVVTLAFLVVLGLSTTQHTRTPHPQIILYVKLVRSYYEFIVCNYKMNLQCWMVKYTKYHGSILN